MESKKRPHADDGEHSRSKKRAVSDERASPTHANGTNTSHADEPKDGDHLETFRKEAIFRRMKYYSREAERSQARVTELERRFNTCQAGLAALEACWTQLLGTIRTLVKPEDLPSLNKESEGIYDLTKHVSSEADPEYVEAIRDKMQTTSDVVKAFVNLTAQSHAGPSNEELRRRCLEAETESSTLRSELSLMRAQLRDSESQRDRVYEQLLSAEKRGDRLQSKSNSSNTLVTEVAPAESTPAENGSSPPPQPPLNGVHSMESDEWRDLAQLREAKIEELTRENAELHEQLQTLQVQTKVPTEELITESMYFKVLVDRVSRSEHTNAEVQGESLKLKEQLDALMLSRSDFENSLKFSNDATIADLKSMLNKRDVETARLREQRDQYQAEINERKAREQNKVASAQEFKALADTRAERITVLESETKRLQTRLAANAGDVDLVSFLWQSTSDSPSYVDDLKRRLTAAEEQVAALEKSVANQAGSVKGEAEARRQLAQVQKQLERYQAVYGDASSMPPETAQLSEQLQHKQDELDKLRLQDSNRDQTESALYDELDKLSAAWEALDRQVKNKVLDLSAMEERVSKLNTERAKSENKFYQCMRDKEATETERKKLAVNLEKAAKAIEKLTEGERNLGARVADLEKEVVLWKKVAEVHKDRSTALEGETHEWRTRAQGERKSAEEIRAAFSEHTQAIDRKRAELRKLEEGLLKSKKDAEKQAAKLKSMTATTGTNAREAELQVEIDQCMSLLKCSTCQMNMRNTVITKCFHTFCKSCVEARIATRQRKCPACNLAFSQGEVQQLYFQ